MKICIIGAGASGILAAISASKNPKNEIYIFEKNNIIGKKMLITGKGRCNITNNIHINDFLDKITNNPKFMYSAFSQFNNIDIVNLLEKGGCKTKVERGDRIFPVSDKSIDVVKTLEKELTKNSNIHINYNSEIVAMYCDNENNINKIEYKDLKKNNVYEFTDFDKIIIATGGKSYPKTGSDGKMYNILEKLGHNITPIRPSIVPFDTYEKTENLMGLSLKNVVGRIVFKNNKGKIETIEEFGEMLFTHFGISGPIVLRLSSKIYTKLEYSNILELFKNREILFEIDFKPALDEKTLDIRIQREILANINKEYSKILKSMLPIRLVEVFLKELEKNNNIEKNKKCNEITKEDRKAIIKLLKNYKIHIKNFRNIDEAIITKGGIDVKEIDSKTMRSKKYNNLYFAGEIIDVDALTGGYNLQIAYSTGYVAGKTI